jgi:cell division septal protein FtsQ
MGWFKSNTKNKRLRREQALDVKISSRHNRVLRWRVVLAALGVSLASLAALCLLWRGGELALERFVYQNDAFALRSYDVQTDGIIPLEKLRQWSGVKLGDNLLALDLSRVKRDLELVPLIKEAAVERILPDGLTVRVTEREPIAQANVLVPRANDGGYDVAIYYLDRDGYAMLPLESAGRGGELDFSNAGLAVLTGINSADLRPGMPAESPQVFAALGLIAAFERSPMFGADDLARIDLSTPEVLLVTTTQGSEVTLALDHLDSQLRRWRTIYNYSLKIGKAIANLDLSVTNNLPALWMEASAEPPVKRDPPKSLHYRKKHV